MNIFIIPSWYPTKTTPVAGIFFQEQAKYLAEYNSLNSVGISSWGQSHEYLQWRTRDLLAPKKIIKKIYFSLSQKRKVIKIKANLYEYYNPVISWTNRILNGNFKEVIWANEFNLKQFLGKVGKVDIIHAHVSYPAGYIAKHLSQKYSIPYVITEHMGPFPFTHLINSDGSLMDIVFEPLNNSKKNIAVSPSLCSRIKSFNLPEPVYIPNIIDEDFFDISNQKISNTKFTFFCLGSITLTKGIRELLFAIQKLVDKIGEEFFIRIGGDGICLEEYQMLAAELRIDKYIKWLGLLSREEAKKEYQKCNAFVLPSHIETFGVVYAEAIACGKPIIGTYSGGPECIINEVNGLLVKVGDIDDLASKMEYMIKNYNHYNARDIRFDFENRFSKKAVIPKLLNLYQEVLTG